MLGVERAKGAPTVRTLARLVVWVLFVLAFFTFVSAAIFAGGGGGVLEVLLYILLSIAFVAAAVYLRSRSEG
jgi:uncharacterized RDD family membrane protein YckC